LNIDVTMTLMATAPRKNGANDHSPWGVPLNRNAGRCQKPQITPRSSAAQSGASLRCNSGSANPRQPNSSIGPFTAISKIIVKTALSESNRKAPVNGLPCTAAPA
jgi:hypothetical protein